MNPEVKEIYDILIERPKLREIMGIAIEKRLTAEQIDEIVEAINKRVVQYE